jgi:hypothetical protein
LWLFGSLATQLGECAATTAPSTTSVCYIKRQSRMLEATAQLKGAKYFGKADMYEYKGYF